MYSLLRVRDHALAVVPDTQATLLLQDAFDFDNLMSDEFGDDSGSYAFRDIDSQLWVLEPLGPSWVDALTVYDWKKK